eukprot:scaffold30051_cov111-Isochrysis_galbana.AAC.3
MAPRQLLLELELEEVDMAAEKGSKRTIASLSDRPRHPPGNALRTACTSSSVVSCTAYSVGMAGTARTRKNRDARDLITTNGRIVKLQNQSREVNHAIREFQVRSKIPTHQIITCTGHPPAASPAPLSFVVRRQPGRMTAKQVCRDIPTVDGTAAQGAYCPHVRSAGELCAQAVSRLHPRDSECGTLRTCLASLQKKPTTQHWRTMTETPLYLLRSDSGDEFRLADRRAPQQAGDRGRHIIRAAAKHGRNTPIRQ